jgi:hypothetical protein
MYYYYLSKVYDQNHTILILVSGHRACITAECLRILIRVHTALIKYKYRIYAPIHYIRMVCVCVLVFTFTNACFFMSYFI